MKHLCIALGLTVVTSGPGIAQHISPDEIVGGPLSGSLPFVNAPFSADAITTARHTLRDGTRLEQSTTARYFRDSAGRVRVELLMEGLGAPKTLSERHIRLAIYPMTVLHRPAPVPTVYTVDPVTRTIRHHVVRDLRPLSIGGGIILGVPVGGVHFVTFQRAQDWIRRHPELVRGAAVQEEPLGTRWISGVETTGQRITLTFPAGSFGNDAPFDVIDEQWESPELGLVIYGHYTDSRTGNIEYRLTNLRRADPSPDLFVVPPDYTLDEPAGSRDDPLIGLGPPESPILRKLRDRNGQPSR